MVSFGRRMTLLCFIIAFSATLIGSLTGLGGGVIIKPAMDLFTGNSISLAQISILSSVTVFSMSVYSTIKGLRNKVVLPMAQMMPLGISAGFGGYAGERLFRQVSAYFGENVCRNVQAFALLALITGVLILYCLKERIHPLALRNIVRICGIGFILGCISSFLGIGGGPINVIMLSLLLSFDDKQCVFGSLFVIIFAQLIKILSVVTAGNFSVPSASILLLMVTGGIFGGVVGSHFALKVSPKTVRSAFKTAMIGIIILNAIILLR